MIKNNRIFFGFSFNHSEYNKYKSETDDESARRIQKDARRIEQLERDLEMYKKRSQGSAENETNATIENRKLKKELDTVNYKLTTHLDDYAREKRKWERETEALKRARGAARCGARSNGFAPACLRLL